MQKKIRLQLRFLIYAEDGQWMAHCLELDIVAHAESPEQAMTDVLELCAEQIHFAHTESLDLRSLFRPAPAEYWEKYFRADDYKAPQWNASQFLDDFNEWLDVPQLTARELAMN